MKKLKLTLVMATLCLFFNQAKAQTIQITGVINNNQGKTLSGATIQILNQNAKTTSKTDGTFNISSQTPTGTLKISYLGYQTKEIQYNSHSVNRFMITLEENNKTLEEIQINAGYYTVKDKERTGNISRIDAKTIQQQPINNPLQSMQGRIPGVEIVQTNGLPGGSFNVKIRGQNSILNGNDPLYIVDGVQVPSTPLSTQTLNLSILPNPSPLSSINPADIESIEVLKDADATAIYGSRGANGVILITTKKGKPGALKLDANIYYGIGEVSRKIDLMNTHEYLEMRKEAHKNDNVTPSASAYDVNGTWDQTKYTDWQKELIGGTANTSHAQLGISGGSLNTTFLLSGTYHKEGTVFPGNSNYQRKSSMFNMNHTTPDQKIQIQFSGSYNLEDSTLPIADLASNILLPPNAPALYLPNGELNWENGTFSNPLSSLLRKYKITTGTLTANGNFSYELLPKLTLSARLGYTKMQRDELQTMPLSSMSPFTTLSSTNRISYFGDYRNQTVNIEPQISWSPNIGSAKSNILLGTTLQNNELHMKTLSASGFVSDGLMENIFAASTVKPLNALNTQYRYLSVYGRFNYNLKDKYYINITGRRDGSSRFGPENTYANFGAIGAAWIFSNEKFLAETLSFMSFGKLRASYGITGNDQIGDYNYLDLWSPASVTYQSQSGLTPTKLFNAIYGWETNKKAELALELGFLEDNLHFNIAYFRNRSSNQLVNYNLAGSTGFSSILRNLPATVQNTGIELESAINVFKKSTFKWSLNWNLSIPKNKLFAFPGLDKSSYANSYVIGQPLTIKKTLQFTGVDKTTGLYTFKDYDGNGSVNTPADQQGFIKLGQKYSGGFQNTFSYKKIKLEFLFQYVKQVGAVYNRGSSASAPGSSTTNQPRTLLKRWQNLESETDIQRFGITTTTNPYFYGRSFGELTMGDASFIRLKNVSLDYLLPANSLKTIGLTNARVFIQGQNLLTITNYVGLDPESQTINAMPPLRVISAGIQLTF